MMMMTFLNHKFQAWKKALNLFSFSINCGIYSGLFLETFCTNPQYRVKVVDPDLTDNDDTGTILIGVMQKDRRRMKKEGKNNMLTIGYAVYKVG